MSAATERPPIHIGETDCDLIADLALRIEKGAPDLSRLLLEEMERATVHPDDEIPPNVVTLGAEVEFADEAAGTTRRVRLVLPGEADVEAGKISVLTSVGAGLIGMEAGARIDWPCPDGRPRRLRIISVDRPA